MNIPGSPAGFIVWGYGLTWRVDHKGFAGWRHPQGRKDYGVSLLDTPGQGFNTVVSVLTDNSFSPTIQIVKQ